MTNEERENAIRCLKLWIEREPQLQTYKTCLEALEQQPCDDAVSRVAVCEIISDIRDCISVEGYCAILERLKKLPPVTPQQKIGHWVDREMYDADRWKCSEMLEHDFEPSDITWAQEVEENSRCEMFIEKGADE